MKNLIIVMFLLLSCNEQKNHWKISEDKTIFIQPFADFNESDSKFILDSLSKCFDNVYLNHTIALPKSAYYKPRNRYRADSLIRILRDAHQPDTISLGLTSKDISITKNGMDDWGVMGLGYRPGRSCVISTFRLHQENKKSQLIKVVLHEIGHTLNLPHCSNQSCLMRDAEGGNPLDDEKDYCTKCKQTLQKNGMKVK